MITITARLVGAVLAASIVGCGGGDPQAAAQQGDTPTQTGDGGAAIPDHPPTEAPRGDAAVSRDAAHDSAATHDEGTDTGAEAKASTDAGAATEASSDTGRANETSSDAGKVTARVMMGVVSDMAPLGPSSTAGTFENMVGRKMAINGAHYYVWNDTSFPSAATGEASDAQSGIASMITWMEELTATGGTPPAVDVNGIASGAEDAVINATAARFNAFGMTYPNHKIYLRIFHEMNGSWEPWNAYGAPAIVSAWRHIHDLFAAAGVKNVTWVFCPNADDIPSTSANRFYNYYPGSTYVDLVGEDVYPGAGNSFSSAVGGVYDYNHATSGWQKPLLIGETATSDSSPPYLAAMESDIKTMWPDIMGVIWFNRNYDTSSDPTGANLTVEQTPAFLGQYKLFLQDPYFELYSE
jgi:beta-mannanase